MSMLPIYVRARDAAFYRNPIVVFPEGFLCFDEEDPPELVLWLPEDNSEPDPQVVIAKRFGSEHGFFGIRAPRREQRVVPVTEPYLFLPAAAFSLQLSRRIPAPKVHEGCEKRTSRVGPAHVIDFPAHHRDAFELEIPE